MITISKRRGIDFELIAAKLNIANGSDPRPMAEAMAMRTTTCFPFTPASCRTRSGRIQPMSANGKRRGDARKFRQRHADTRLRRITHEFTNSHKFVASGSRSLGACLCRSQRLFVPAELRQSVLRKFRYSARWSPEAAACGSIMATLRAPSWI